MPYSPSIELTCFTTADGGFAPAASLTLSDVARLKPCVREEYEREMAALGWTVRVSHRGVVGARGTAFVEARS